MLLQEAEIAIARQTLPRFATEPRNLRIDRPRRIIGAKRIFIGDSVWLGPGSLLVAVTRYPTSPMGWSGREPRQIFDSRIMIGSGVVATAGLQVAAHREVIIEDDVLFATNVNITDGLHGHENPYEPYKYQEISHISPIVIKRGCWIGQNVVVLPGVTIGEFCIVGANSVVTESIPARSIAVGAPARVIKRWNESTREWDSVIMDPVQRV